jgi:hypothetical protein
MTRPIPARTSRLSIRPKPGVLVPASLLRVSVGGSVTCGGSVSVRTDCVGASVTVAWASLESMPSACAWAVLVTDRALTSAAVMT